MSALAISPVRRAVRFYEAPIGKKVVMAITGLILFGYVIGHLLGNLQIYASHDQINNFLHLRCDHLSTARHRASRTQTSILIYLPNGSIRLTRPDEL